ncbi:unnamed protein product [Arctogadus glacialis]
MSTRPWYQSGCGPSGTPLVSCKLCLGDFPSDHMTTVSQCRCVFCTLCLRSYVSLLLSEGLEAEVSCPDAACPERGRLLDTEIEAAVEPESMRRYRRLRFEREVLLDPGRTWCPAPSCQAVCRLQGAESAAPQAVGCPGCGLEFCSACRAPRHPGGTCPDPSGTDGRFLPGEHRLCWGGGVPVQPCPRCQVFIQRDQGCAQMTCGNCKHCFCWHCLDSLDEDVLLIHYDKGPCRNKLGHSRASVIWHRTQVHPSRYAPALWSVLPPAGDETATTVGTSYGDQVVGTFAGFGFILLAASPFLLLAAPLFFCCPWNRSRRGDDPLPT